MVSVASSRRAAAWIALFLFAVTVAMQGRIGHNIRFFQIAYVLGFLGYATLAMDAWRHRKATVTTRWYWYLVGCIALRLILLPMVPSDDTYRYAWEGRIQHAGFNPYSHAPDDPALDALHNEDWKRINHPDYPAIYGPFAQIQFRMITWFSSNVAVIKSAHVFWDLLTVMVLGACLRRLGMNPLLAFAYGLNPLVLTAFGIEGHLDSLMLLLLSLTLWGVIAKRQSIAGVSLGLALGVKIVPIVLLPWFLFRMRRVGLIAVLVCGACYLPYVSAGWGLFESMRRFGTGNMFFGPLSILCGAVGLEDPSSLNHARTLAAVVMGVVLITLGWRAKKFETYSGLATTTLLLLSPIVHFWYWSWVVLLLPFRLRASWMATSCAMVLYFEATRNQELTGEWSMPHWPGVVVWSSFLIAWVAGMAWRRRMASDSPYQAQDDPKPHDS